MGSGNHSASQLEMPFLWVFIKFPSTLPHQSYLRLISIIFSGQMLGSETLFSSSTKYGGRVPRESVYDTELTRILSNWLQQQYGRTVTSQWDLQDHPKKYKYFTIVLKKEGYPTTVLELFGNRRSKLWQVAHSEDNRLHDPSLGERSMGHSFHWRSGPFGNPTWSWRNVVHFAPDLDFTNVLMSARWKDCAGNIQQVNNQFVTV
jgi:hypothetical protein